MLGAKSSTGANNPQTPAKAKILLVKVKDLRAGAESIRDILATEKLCAGIEKEFLAAHFDRFKLVANSEEGEVTVMTLRLGILKAYIKDVSIGRQTTASQSTATLVLELSLALPDGSVVRQTVRGQDQRYWASAETGLLNCIRQCVVQVEPVVTQSLQ